MGNQANEGTPGGDQKERRSAIGERIKAYHNQSKHHFRRYAPGPGGMDWSNQPDPYRRFQGAAEVKLPLCPSSAVEKKGYSVLYEGVSASEKAEKMSVDSISSLLFHSMALSAKKVVMSSSWCLRVNPSSGNLHPTEAYLAARRRLVEKETDGQPSGAVYHYRADGHLFERRCAFDFDALQKELIVNGESAATVLGEEFFLVMLTSIHWRESWKYGMRAWRYCNHDAGHAAAALQFSARLHGWECVFFVPTAGAEALVGAERLSDFPVQTEREHLDMVGLVLPSSHLAALGAAPNISLSLAGMEVVRRGEWRGVASPLSEEHGDAWPQIDAVEELTCLPTAGLKHTPSWSQLYRDGKQLQEQAALYMTSRKQNAAAIIRQRRSAQELMAEQSRMLSSQFFGVLSRLVPSIAASPWQSLHAVVAGLPRVHLLFFVHRVKGMRPGLLFLARDMPEEQLAELKASCKESFLWERVEDAPSGMQLFRLLYGDARQAGKDLSCGQDIASDGCFAVAMMADTQSIFNGTSDPHFYKRIFWEAGAIGQVLYLEAEANHLRGTGIGCFFDDPTHQLFYGRAMSEMEDDDVPLQSIYHFAFGAPSADKRLRTVDPYAV